jgi:hypothetical protein
MKRIEFEGQTHEFPDDFTDADISSALSGTSPSPASKPDRVSDQTLSTLITGEKPDTRSWFQKAADFVTPYVAKAVPAIPFQNPLKYDPNYGTETLAKIIVPQSLTELGIMAGTGLAGKGVGAAVKGASAAARLWPVAGRVAGATAGGALGGSSEEGAGVGALKGLAAGALGESTAYGVGKVARSLPGMARKIASEDTTKIAKTIPTIADKRAKDVVIKAIDETLSRIKQLEDVPINSPRIAARIAEQKRYFTNLRNNIKAPGIVSEAVPEVFEGVTDAASLHNVASGEGKTRLKTWFGNRIAKMEALLGREMNVPSLSDEPISLTKAIEARSKIGDRAFSRNPLDRTIQGIDQRALYNQVSDEIRADLGQGRVKDGHVVPSLLESDWDVTNKIHSSMSGALNLLAKPRFYSGELSGMTFNMPALQAMLRDTRVRRKLEEQLGKDGLKALTEAVTRGGKVGSQDVPAKNLYNTSLIELLGRGGLPGLGWWFGGPKLAAGAIAGQLALPNITARYAGRTPYAAHELTKLLADLAAAKAVGSAK